MEVYTKARINVMLKKIAEFLNITIILLTWFSGVTQG